MGRSRGSGGANRLDGGFGDDSLVGGGGTDVLSDGDGIDTMTGGANNDTLSGGAGSDTFLYTFGDGADSINGGADSDTLDITGTPGNDTLDLLYDGTTLTQFEAGTLIDLSALDGQPCKRSPGLRTPSTQGTRRAAASWVGGCPRIICDAGVHTRC